MKSKRSDETWVRTAIPKHVHTELTIEAVRAGISLQGLIRLLLEKHVGAPAPTE